MNLSIVISCSDDLHILKTLDSINEDVEVICSITPNQKIEQLLIERNIPYVITPKGNHSITTNAGISLAKNDKLILMDSDCIFAPNAIQAMSSALDNYLVVNGKIIFEHDESRLSNAISECREFDNEYERPAYKPGLGLHKKILEKVGFWFHPKIPWSLDSELSYRVKKANIEIKHISTPCVYHVPTSFRHNMKACLNFGIGDCLRVHMLKQPNGESLLIYETKRYQQIVQKLNCIALALMIFNDLVYYIGYFNTYVKIKLGIITEQTYKAKIT